MPYLDIEHGRVFYKDTKPSDGSSPKETFIFHHGLGSTHCFYQSIIPALTSPPYNFRCIIYDTIGSGLSDLAKETQSVEALSQDVIDILKVLEIDKAVLVGHSMGGIVAAHLAATKNDIIIATILIGPVLPSPEGAKVFEERIKKVDKGEKPIWRPIASLPFIRGHGSNGRHHSYDCHGLPFEASTTRLYSNPSPLAESERLHIHVQGSSNCVTS